MTYFDEILADVFLWDVMGGTKYYILPCPEEDIWQMVGYLRLHGYTADYCQEIYLCGPCIQVTRAGPIQNQLTN